MVPATPGTSAHDRSRPPQGVVSRAAVTVVSVLFSEVLSAEAGGDGAFRIDGLPVGPVTVTARDSDGRSAYATLAIDGPGATADVVLRLEGAPPDIALGQSVVAVLAPVAGPPVARAGTSRPRPQAASVGRCSDASRARLPSVSLPASPYRSASGSAPTPTLSRTTRTTRGNVLTADAP